MLFSEPKISQSWFCAVSRNALGFQCSSASRKFLNYSVARIDLQITSFSALQRAENFSTRTRCAPSCAIPGFSALQRAENFSIEGDAARIRKVASFSALQRAENFSTIVAIGLGFRAWRFSALQRAENFSTIRLAAWMYRQRVSVLFSEPKISQPT